MTFLQRSRGVAGGVALLMLACLATSPASAQVVDRGNLVVTSPAQTVASASVVTYSISVKNDSTVTVTGMTVTMNLPGGTQFVNCSRLPAGQLCQESTGVVTTTYPTIAAHATVTFRLLANMPAVSQNTVLDLVLVAHADKAINGEEPRNGDLTVATTVLPPTTRLQLLPSGRTVPVGCGFTLDAATFGDDMEGQLLDQLICTTGSGVTVTASGKTLNLGSVKITSPVRVKGNAGIIIGPNAANVTIKGGGTLGTRGVEQFEYCLKDLGGNAFLHITDLRCYRSKTAGLLLLSDNVLVESSLVDNTLPDALIEVPAGGGGVGIQAGGDNLHVKDTKVRRSAKIGFWAYGVDTDGSGRVATYDGSTATSRIESNFGIGAVLAGGPHRIADTQIQADDAPTTVSLDGIVVEGTAPGTTLEGVVIKKHLGDAIRVEAGAVRTVIARTSVESIGGSGYVINAQSTLNGSSAELVAKDAFVINATATLTSNKVENCSANAFVINAPALVDSNTAIDNGGYGFVVSNTVPAILAADWSAWGVGDFDSDGKDDILWHQPTGGSEMWLMDGANIKNLIWMGIAGTDWTPQLVGDFDGDGKADILWFHPSGGFAIWLMDGATIKNAIWMGTAGAGWRPELVGDFDGDGKADILWVHSSGAFAIWLMDGATIRSAIAMGTAGTGWTPDLVGDFDGDGKADILWRHVSGAYVIWLMDGATIKSATSMGIAGAGWNPELIGDFDGDGKADILWRHSSGALAMWLMNGSTIKSSPWLGNVSSDWTLHATGDFNGDGKADILWRRASGATTTWFMNGPSLLSASGGGLLRSNSAEGNALGGFLVSGGGTLLVGNSAQTSRGPGFNISSSGNVLNTNKAERDAGAEFLIGSNNIDSGNNSANGARFSFPTTGGTFQ